MTNAGTESGESQRFETAVQEPTDPNLDIILTYWRRIAATAWEGALTVGPGFVGVAAEGDTVLVQYQIGAPCSCHREEIASYNPEEQLVVVVRRYGQVSAPLVLSGWPAPPDAYALATADVEVRSVGV